MPYSLANLLPPFIALLLTYGLCMLLYKTRLADLFSDAGGGKKLHKKAVPASGGIAIVLGIFGASAWFYPEFLMAEKWLFLGLTGIFSLGLIDDLKQLGWLPKLIAQLLLIGFVVAVGDVRLETVLFEDRFLLMPYALSVILSIGILTFGTNAFNFIDGSDGLAALVALTAILGMLFFQIPFFNPFLFVVVAAVFGFRMLNKEPAKIFMGDSGSLFLGLLCSVLLIKFIEADLSTTNYWLETYSQRLPVAIALFWFPVFDTLRVFSLRLRAGKSLFERDKLHSYSLLLRLGYRPAFIALLVFLATLIQVLGAVYLVPVTGIYLYFVLQAILWFGFHFYLRLLVKQFKEEK
ncbi:MAG: hypothetical protein COA80_06635 [Leeuwenhoekiella sp.]|nr:MAG: hypothetical protein COA80_06635 [Leeuwenhoekiella sp.]